jgi:hypothetical protein
MASFFALGVDRFPRDAQGNTAWPLGYVCGLLCKSIPFKTLASIPNLLLVGISMALSIPLLIIAFNITWLTTPWNYLRHIWFKKVFFWLLRCLRYLPIAKIRSKAYDLNVKLWDSLYAYSQPSTETHSDRMKERMKLWDGLSWRLQDRKFIDLAEAHFKSRKKDDDGDDEDEDEDEEFLDRYLERRLKRLKEKQRRRIYI